jgi:hypothetical protein
MYQAGMTASLLQHLGDDRFLADRQSGAVAFHKCACHGTLDYRPRVAMLQPLWFRFIRLGNGENDGAQVRMAGFQHDHGNMTLRRQTAPPSR